MWYLLYAIVGTKCGCVVISVPDVRPVVESWVAITFTLCPDRGRTLTSTVTWFSIYL